MKARKPKVLEQAEMLNALAKEHGCTHLKVGEFEVAFGSITEPRDRVGFDVAPTPPDEFYEARGRKV